MSEPAWSMPMNRAELIARCEALEAALEHDRRMWNLAARDAAQADARCEKLEAELADKVRSLEVCSKGFDAICKRALASEVRVKALTPSAQSKSQQKRFEAQGVAHVPFAVRHAVTCKLFPDPCDERDPVGPCTCGADKGNGGELTQCDGEDSYEV